LLTICTQNTVRDVLTRTYRVDRNCQVSDKHVLRSHEELLF